MNKAYSLEAKEAQVPRIIIDPKYSEKLMEYNEKEYRDNVIKREINGNIIRKDAKDGRYYLNYLNSIYAEPDANETVMKIFTLCQIERSKERADETLNKSIKDKYDWLEDYLKDYFEINY